MGFYQKEEEHMLLPQFFQSLDISILEKYTDEVLKVNEKTKQYGLVLTSNEIKDMIISRNQILYNYGRVETDISVIKELAEVFCTSPYIDNKNYQLTLNELQEIFYYMKNETEDRISDSQLVDIIREYFDGVCGGSLELLKSKLDEFAQRFRSDVRFRKSVFEGDEHLWD